MSEAAAKPGGSRLPQPRGGIPRPRPAAGSSSNLTSRRVTRQSISAPDLSKIGTASKTTHQRPQDSLLRRAVATASSKAIQPSTLAGNRKRPAPSALTVSEPDKKKPLVVSNKQNARAPVGVKKVPSSTAAPATAAPAKRKPAQWDIKARLEHANEKISNLSQENEFLRNAAAEAVNTQNELVKTKADLDSMKVQLTDTNSKLEFLTKSENDLRVEVENTLQELAKTRAENETLNVELINLRQRYDTVFKSEQELKTINQALSYEVACLKNENSTLTSKLDKSNRDAAIQDENRLEQIFHEQQMKRSLLNQILDLKGNIRVFCRVRPPLDTESDKVLVHFNFPNEASVELKIPEKSSFSKQADKKTVFSYDRVFAPVSSQSDIYDELSALVQSALDGHNVCVFAYGQTGSGKTYTMEGGNSIDAHGMIPRSIKTIFDTIKVQNKLGWEFSVRCSVLEIYNENIRDLIHPKPDVTHEVKMVDSNSEDIYVSNLKVEVIHSEEELQKVLVKAQKNRFTAATVMNDQSSRSHSITQIKLDGINKSRNIKSQGTLNLIDLAGSEEYKSENKSDRKAETLKINKSLATLSLVVLRLAGKADHVPFRESKLTHLLMPSLKGNSKTLMIVNIAPFEDCLNDTISSLRFASRVSAVKVDSKRQIKSTLGQATVSKSIK